MVMMAITTSNSIRVNFDRFMISVSTLRLLSFRWKSDLTGIIIPDVHRLNKLCHFDFEISSEKKKFNRKFTGGSILSLTILRDTVL